MMRGKNRYVLILLAIVLAVVLLTGSASRHDSVQQGADILHEEYDLEWAHAPAIEPESAQEGFEYYSTICIDEPPTTAELNA